MYALQCNMMTWQIFSLHNTRGVTPVLHSKTKHIEVRFHFLRGHYEKGDVDLRHIDTQNQLADIFTKLLDQTQFACL
jgi:hypothetical protein